MQISEDLETPCEEFRDRLNFLEREMEAIGGGYVGTHVNEKLDVQTNVLQDMRANRAPVDEQAKYAEFQKDELNLANENIENFLPD